MRQWWPPTFSPTGTGGSESFLGSLDDDVAFKLAQGHEDRRKEHAGRCARVDLFLNADDLDALFSEMVDDRVEVFGGAAEAREALDDEEVAVAEDLLEFLELRAIFGCNGGFFDEETVGGDAVAVECVEMAIEILGLRGHAGITKYHCN